MTSILTNTSAMIALRTLDATNNALTNTQNEISTGLKVSSAKDNASTWAVATQMRSDVRTLGQVSENLGSADSIVGTALAGATQIATLISQIRSAVTKESDSSQNQADIQNDITQLVNQIQQVVQSSSYNGVNMLASGGSNSLTFQSTSVSNSSGVTNQIATITVSPFANASAAGSAITNLDTTSGGSNSGLAGLQEFATGGSRATLATTAGSLSAALTYIDDMAENVNTVAASLGSAQANIESEQTFNNNLADTLQTGVSGLVDADMTAESARLTALQTQQQLGTQALSIANQAPQMILKLFQ